MWEKFKSAVTYVWDSIFGADGSTYRDYTGVFPQKTKPKNIAQRYKVSNDQDNKVISKLKGGFLNVKDSGVTLNVKWLGQRNLEPGTLIPLTGAKKSGCLFTTVCMQINFYKGNISTVKECNDFLNKCKEKNYKYVTGNAFVEQPEKMAKLKELSIKIIYESINDKIKTSQKIIDLINAKIPVTVTLLHDDYSDHIHFEVIFGYHYDKSTDEVVFLVHDPGYQNDLFIDPYTLKAFYMSGKTHLYSYGCKDERNKKRDCKKISYFNKK